MSHCAPETKLKLIRLCRLSFSNSRRRPTLRHRQRDRRTDDIMMTIAGNTAWQCDRLEFGARVPYLASNNNKDILSFTKHS